ncbi:hypothetical protein BDW74DRAFT_51378 [Aspergillus multicolor]|uniref:mitochondrial 37S ribosomal protein bS21m n=1 Tax=Aspergillus multicolor TaxID=41759 RepID=UPI003CCCDD29
MERSLTRCLRLRPTTSLLATRQSILTNPSLFARPTTLQPLRFNSSNPTNNVENSPQTPKTTATTASPFSRTQRAPLRSKQQSTEQLGVILKNLNFASKNPTKNVGARAQYAAQADTAKKEPTLSMHERKSKVQMKLDPKLGREVTISPDRGVDLDRALVKLNNILKENNVKFQQLDQKFHIRKGQAKKLLRMRRWRKLFRYSFAHTVGKIQRMRAQGW